MGHGLVGAVGRGDCDLYIFLTKATEQTALHPTCFVTGHVSGAPLNTAWGDQKTRHGMMWAGFHVNVDYYSLFYKQSSRCASWVITEDKNTIICFNPNLSNVSI